MKYSHHSWAHLFTLAAATAVAFSCCSPAMARTHKHHADSQASASVHRHHSDAADRPASRHHHSDSQASSSDSTSRHKRHHSSDQTASTSSRRRHRSDQADSSDTGSSRHRHSKRDQSADTATSVRRHRSVHEAQDSSSSDQSAHLTRHERRLLKLHEEHLAQIQADHADRAKHLTRRERRLLAEHEARVAHLQHLAALDKKAQAHKAHLAHLAKIQAAQHAARLAQIAAKHGHVFKGTLAEISQAKRLQAQHKARLAKIQALHNARLAKIQAKYKEHLERLAILQAQHEARLQKLKEQHEAQAAINPSSSIHEWNDYAAGVPVKIIVVDLNDPRVQVSALLSANGIGSSEPFSHMIARAHPDVAVTGTFFSLDNLHPIGDIVIKGNLAYFGGMGTALCITPNNHADMITVPWGHHHDWSGYDCVVACGPRLLQDSKIVLDPHAERFKDQHMLAPNSRIGVGITKDNKLVFVMTHKAIYLGRLAKVMKALGCRQAMNLDAGTSTGFYCGGHLLARPGRRLTNAIVVYAKGKSDERTAGRSPHVQTASTKPPL